ncbi:helix-turn-helix transcriptional regulator [Leptolyngbya sp. AN03gr2]|uniref:helix-turn-helix transcriptional regulator n=1 Tax=unclassified Leptolyngbya TaxID=2650499 RepID=UPI003D314291
MSKPIAQREFNEIWQAASTQNEIWTWEGNRGWRHLPPALGQGQRQVTTLRDGFELWFDDVIYNRPLHLDYLYQIPQITLTFYLSGDFRIINPGLRQEEDRSEVSGESCICYLPEVRSIEYYTEKQPLQRITLSVDVDFLRSYTDWQLIPDRIRQLIDGKSVEPFHQTLGLQSMQHQPLLQQMLTCPYQGAMRHLYLESKALELLTLQFWRWAQDEQPLAKTPQWKPQDLEKLYQAQEILRRSLDRPLDQRPPSLLEIARQVGLNDCKLKQGFRQVFGTTVFGYLRTYQMEQAQRLLAETDASITEIAYAVGYGSLPAFSNAFYRQFGISPKAYRYQ